MMQAETTSPIRLRRAFTRLWSDLAQRGAPGHRRKMLLREIRRVLGTKQAEMIDRRQLKLFA